MLRTRILHILATLVLLVALLHGAALAFFLYWKISWFDILPHFFGGMFASLLSVWVWYFSGYLGAHPLPKLRTLFVQFLLSAFVIGVGWEVFERVLNLMWSPEGYWTDSSLDVAFDVLGGVVSFFLVRRMIRTTPSLV